MAEYEEMKLNMKCPSCGKDFYNGCGCDQGNAIREKYAVQWSKNVACHGCNLKRLPGECDDCYITRRGD